MSVLLSSSIAAVSPASHEMLRVAPASGGVSFGTWLGRVELQHHATQARLQTWTQEVAGGAAFTMQEALSVQLLVSAQSLRVELAARLVDGVAQGGRQLLQAGGGA